MLVRHPGWPTMQLAAHVGHHMELTRACVLIGMAALAKKAHAPCGGDPHVHVLKKPGRRVLAAQAFADGGLVLVPETTKVGSRPSGVGSNSAPTVMLSGPGFEPSDTEVLVSSSSHDTCVVPAWAV